MVLTAPPLSVGTVRTVTLDLKKQTTKQDWP